MSGVFDVEPIIERWAEITYKESLERYWKGTDDKVMDITYTVLKRQKILDEKMLGTTMQNLKVNENDSKVRFSDIIEMTYKSYFSPAVFVYGIVGEYIDKFKGGKAVISDELIDEITPIVGRGNRAFASFLREVDLSWKIEKKLGKGTVKRTPDQDVGEHTDILLGYRESQYRLWSYLVSAKGLKYTALRFNEGRGKIPDGNHILCPMNVNSKDMLIKHGWYLYSDYFVDRLAVMIEKQTYEQYAGEKREQEYFKKLHMIKK